MAGFNDVEVPRSSSYVSLKDHVEPLALSDFAGDQVDVRVLANEDNPMVWEAVHWVYVLNNKEGATQKQAARSFNCLDFDNVTGKNAEKSVCPWCQAGHNPQRKLYANVLVRSYQEDKPARVRAPNSEEEATGYKDVVGGSKAWTPVRVWGISSTLVIDIKAINKNNKRKIKSKSGETEVRVFDITDPKFGRDITIAYNPDHKVAAKRTQVMVGDNRDPLTDEEKSFLQFKLDAAVLFPKPPLASIKSFIKANLKTGVFSAKSLEAKSRLEFSRDLLSDSGNSKLKTGGAGSDVDDDSDDDAAGSEGISDELKSAIVMAVSQLVIEAGLEDENDDGDKVVDEKRLKKMLRRAEEFDAEAIVAAVAEFDEELDLDTAEEIANGLFDFTEVFETDEDGNLRLVEKPKKRKGSTKAAGKPKAVEHDPDEDDLPATPAKKKKAAPVEVDEDLDDDDSAGEDDDDDSGGESESEDDEDFSPPAKNKRPQKKPDFDFDDDDLDD